MDKKKLKKKIISIFKNHGLNEKHSIICADAIINAELVGAPTHGLSRLKMYCDRINHKLINPKPKIKIKNISHSVSHINADDSIGFVAADVAIKKVPLNSWGSMSATNAQRESLKSIAHESSRIRNDVFFRRHANKCIKDAVSFL